MPDLFACKQARLKDLEAHLAQLKPAGAQPAVAGAAAMPAVNSADEPAQSSMRVVLHRRSEWVEHAWDTRLTSYDRDCAGGNLTDVLAMGTPLEDRRWRVCRGSSPHTSYALPSR